MTTGNCFVGLGSNLGDCHKSLDFAAREIGRLKGVSALKLSARYETAPLKLLEQPPFLNQVISFQTGVEPLALLDALQAIETKGGRLRAERYGPRTLDLDIILYGNRVIESERLTLPHYDLHNRLWLLTAIIELNRGLVHPKTSIALADYAQKLEGKQQLRRLS